MEGLLHWDFNPGLTMEDQFRRRFRSTVHFSRGSTTKEFFLVVSFSSASFPLSCSLVGLALQCCIGGLASGFNVVHLDDRSYRFSVASNKVGHFIYALRDRIWPDFVCHFSLFKERWSLPTSGFHVWHADEVISGVSSRSPSVVKTNLKFLENSAANDHSSQHELSKFGFNKMSQGNLSSKFDEEVLHQNSRHITKDIVDVHMDFQNNADHNIQPRLVSPEDPFSMAIHEGISLKFGSMVISKLPANQSITGPTFLGKDHKTYIWNSISDEILFHILDLRQAKYNDANIMQALSILDVPSLDYIYTRLGRCTICSVVGHTDSVCSTIKCDTCKCFSRACSCANMFKISPGLGCSTCNSLQHVSASCPAHIICTNCFLLGHRYWDCAKESASRLFWRPTATGCSTSRSFSKNIVAKKNPVWVWKVKRKSDSAMPVLRNKSYRGGTACNSRKKIWKIKSIVGEDGDMPDTFSTPPLVTPHPTGSADNDQDDGVRVWNEHVAMVEVAAEAVLNGSPPGELRFVSATGTDATMEVPLPKNLLDFLTDFYSVVCTPRICGVDDSISFSNIFSLATAALQELVGTACFSLFPFSPFQQGSNTVIFSQVVWAVTTEILSMKLNDMLHNGHGSGDTLCLISLSSDSSGSMDVDAENVGVLIAGLSRKRRRPAAAPLDVSEVRRSTRSTRYMGFRPPSLADVQKRATHVKPRCIPGLATSDADIDCHQDTASSSNMQAEIPPETTIKELQQMGSNCGVPPEEITEAALLQNV